CQHGHGVLTF
nr:immunoglobulin light chain junction region [Macaca mulatta]MOY12516.1 immunoglobulin light chain junction region [Macaca mulatta]MOY12748.1 immunoglobulin light chain junction region [Macaca mulatta]MOY12910.1 immunoglobulin light chain junction region [Macaca mulatta]MOY13461.1 immunoglobulin light chain junction region [Macaca mulatta]